MKSTATVYIVDDEPDVTDALRWLIESVGYQVSIFNSAKQFLSTKQSNEPACLVLDVRMPEVSGLELQDIMNSKGVSNIPIIFISGHGDVPMAVRAMKAGAIDFLTKPVNNQLLLESINRAIRLSVTLLEKEEKRNYIKLLSAELTPREEEVMQLMIAGKSTKFIAEALTISPNTAELHRAKVMRKMKVKTLAELMTLILGSSVA